MDAHVGVVGLGVMGASLARNFHSRGRKVAVHNRGQDKLGAFAASYGDERFVICPTLQALVDALERPRKVVILVSAGRAVDAVLHQLLPLLSADDIVIDAGNSHFADTERRGGIETSRFVGMGVSGGEEGALKGPSLMPGGDADAWEEIRPLLEEIAARSDAGPCVSWCGRGSAGHYVKMVHNGIEYADMQLIAEVWTLLRQGLDLPPPAVRDVFARWNEGRLSSYLIEITSRIVAAQDPKGRGPLLDRIQDVAGQKGTGRWTSISAVEQGVPLSTITAAVDSRALSARKRDRDRTAAVFGTAGVPALDLEVNELEAALYASKIVSYTQGFDLLRAASADRHYDTDLSEVARIWKAGCIIRAALLDRIHESYSREPHLPLLLLEPFFAEAVSAALPAWRKVVATAVSVGVPVPALSASLAWFDTLASARGSAALIQAQRDYFGAHTYRRIEAPHIPIHTRWEELEQLGGPANPGQGAPAEG